MSRKHHLPTGASWGDARSKPRALFYSHDGLGLGHLRITLAVARSFIHHLPETSALLLTGSASVGEFHLPETLDYVRMPGLDKRPLFEDDRHRRLPPPPDLFALRQTIIAAAVTGFAPDFVVVDHHPAGLAGEFKPVLQRFRGAERRPLFVLGLRDITYGAERTRRDWERSGAYSLLEDDYDMILVYGSRDVFDPIAEYGLSEAIAAKMRFTGYLPSPAPPRSIAEVRAELGAERAPLVVVSAGGGIDGAPLIQAFLEAVQSGMVPGVVASVATGPHMPPSEVARLAALAELLPGVTLFRFRNDFECHVAAADVVVTMGGYNSIWEAIGAGRQPIVVPRQGGSDEQPVRAARLAALGLVTELPAADLTPRALARAITAELDRGVTVAPPVTVDFNGGQRAAEALASLIGLRTRGV